MRKRSSLQRNSSSTIEQKQGIVVRWWRNFAIGTLVVVLRTLGAGFMVVHRLTAQCVLESKKAITRQTMLRKEIDGRREAFVLEIRRASTLAEVAAFATKKDLLHGYRYAEFKDRTISELEDEEQRNASDWDAPSFFALDLQTNFLHEYGNELFDDPERATGLRHPSIWKALETQDVSDLKDGDFKALQAAAEKVLGWLFVEARDEGINGRPAPYCSFGQTIDDLWQDNEYYMHVRYPRFEEAKRKAELERERKKTGR